MRHDLNAPHDGPPSPEMVPDGSRMKQGFTDIVYAEEGVTAVVTINRPHKLNAFRLVTIREMTTALNRASKNSAVRVIVICGAGGRAFSVGGDLNEMKDLDRRSGKVFVAALESLGLSFLNCPKPVLARVGGYCLGGGNEIQLFCDLTIASDRSVFGQTGAKVGSAPLWGGTQILPGLMGLKRAKEAMLLCRTYTAHEAREIGMINRVVLAEDLDAAVRETCETLAGMSPQSIRLIKQSLHADLKRELRRDLKRITQIYGSPELKEGMTAFLEKRKPVFRL